MSDHELWPRPTPAPALAARRASLEARLSAPALIVSGFSRPRNFHANRYPFRAESHFLYLVGRALEGAALLLGHGAPTLYVEEPDPAEALWSGPAPSLAALEAELGLAVRPFAELSPPPGTTTVPPQDAESAFWLGELLERDIEPAGGPRLTGPDVALAEALIAVRLCHDAAAIDQLRQAAAVTERAHRAGLGATRAGVREAWIRGAMEGAILAHGMVPSYHPIVTVHGEVLHNEHHHGLAQAGDLLLADVGAETPEGWAGDVTRTWPVGGRFSAGQRAVYEAVLHAQQVAIAMVAPGGSYRSIHRAAGLALLEGLIGIGLFRGSAEDLFQRNAAAVFFPHGVGHLLGLDVHDMEDLGDRAGYAPGRTRSTAPGERFLRLDRELAPGMVVTIEPGYYRIPGLLADEALMAPLRGALDTEVLARLADVRGIRIEDDILVTPTGHEVLTGGIPRSVEAIEAAVGQPG